jgi:hypothetical protein
MAIIMITPKTIFRERTEVSNHIKAIRIKDKGNHRISQSHVKRSSESFAKLIVFL